MSDFRWLSKEELSRLTSVRWSTHQCDVVPLDAGELGCAIPLYVRLAILESLQENDLGYAPLARRSRLPDAVVDYFQRVFTWPILRSNVVPVANTLQALAYCLEDIKPRFSVLAIGPLYPGLRQAIEGTGYQIVQIDLEVSADGTVILDLGKLDDFLATGINVVVMTYPHSPTGFLFDQDALVAFVSILERRTASLIVDEVYAPLVFDPLTYTPLGKAIGGASSVYTIGSISKAWNLASLKAGWIICPNAEASARLQRLPIHFVGQLGTLATKCATACLNCDPSWLDSLRHSLQQNSEIWIKYLAENCPSLTVYRPRAGMYVWMSMPQYAANLPLSQAILRRAHIAVGSGAGYIMHSNNCIRVNIALEPVLLAESAIRVSNAINSLALDI
jgi:cysteine-S-conjugate beta-lyase